MISNALLLLALCAELPVIDEGNRWEQACVVWTWGENGNHGSVYFWRRDAFGNLEAGASVPWHDIETIKRVDGEIEFRWFDGGAAWEYETEEWQAAYRVCRVPEVYWHTFHESERWQVPPTKNIGWGFLELPVVERAK